MFHVFFIYFSVDGHLGCFHILAIVTSTVIKRGVHVSFLIIDFSGYTPRSGIAGSYVSFNFSFLSQPEQGKQLLQMPVQKQNLRGSFCSLSPSFCPSHPSSEIRQKSCLNETPVMLGRGYFSNRASGRAPGVC